MTAPTRRRTPRWAVEAVAWAASLVLVAAVAVTVSGVIDTDAPVAPAQVLEQVDDTPVIDAVEPTPAATVAPAPVATRAPAVAAPRPPAKAPTRAGTTLSSRLGPPPGPQTDRVPTTFAAPENRYAFLVGVTDYPSPTHDTIGSANDVLFIRQMLISAGWPSANIRIYTNRQVTGAVIREGARWLAGKSQPGTFTFFHYSGHVKQVGSVVKLWPADRDFIPSAEFASLLRPGLGRMWVDIAGCEAGGFIEDLPSAHRLVTTSSLKSQKSYEYPSWAMSVWSGLVFDIGLRQKQADANKDGVTTIGETLRYSAYYAQAITIDQRPHGRQTPQVYGDAVLGWTLANPPS